MTDRMLRSLLGLLLAFGILVAASDTASAAPTRRTKGLPTSPNGASSMHAWLDDASGTRMQATVTVARPPSVAALYFWALQVTFVDASGATVGGAHIGLQWHPRHPGSTAVNFGGYSADGVALEGSTSALPSATGNENTRDYPWKAGASYRLTVFKNGGGWTGAITDLATGVVTEIRTLNVDAASVDRALVFSEVFAPCDAPRSEVVWTGLKLPGTATYQSVEAGGCSNSDQRVIRRGVVQRTNANRTVMHEARLAAS